MESKQILHLDFDEVIIAGFFYANPFSLIFECIISTIDIFCLNLRKHQFVDL